MQSQQQQQQEQHPQAAARKGAASAVRSFLGGAGAGAEQAGDAAKTGNREHSAPAAEGPAKAAGKRPATSHFGEETQTEYVRIAPAPKKRPRRDALTEHQRETALLQRQGTLPSSVTPLRVFRVQLRSAEPPLLWHLLSRRAPCSCSAACACGPHAMGLRHPADA